MVKNRLMIKDRLYPTDKSYLIICQLSKERRREGKREQRKEGEK